MTFLGKTFCFFMSFLVQNASYERLGEKPWGIDEHKWNLTKMYVESLRFETKSLMSEASDSGMGTEGAPSEFDVDIGVSIEKSKLSSLVSMIIIIIKIIIIIIIIKIAKLYLNAIII